MHLHHNIDDDDKLAANRTNTYINRYNMEIRARYCLSLFLLIPLDRFTPLTSLSSYSVAIVEVEQSNVCKKTTYVWNLFLCVCVYVQISLECELWFFLM